MQQYGGHGDGAVGCRRHLTRGRGQIVLVPDGSGIRLCASRSPPSATVTVKTDPTPGRRLFLGSRWSCSPCRRTKHHLFFSPRVTRWTPSPECRSTPGCDHGPIQAEQPAVVGRFVGEHGPAEATPALVPPTDEHREPIVHVLLDRAEAGCGVAVAEIAAHRDPAAPQDVSAQDLVPQRVKPSPGSALAVRYSVCCRARTLSNGTLSTTTTPLSAGLAVTALTGHLHSHSHASTKQWPFPHRRLCCPLGSTGVK